jgi:hypothetical protein
MGKTSLKLGQRGPTLARRCPGSTYGYGVVVHIG